MMKTSKMVLVGLVALALLALAAPSFAAKTASADAEATLVAAIAVEQVADLRFGSILAGTAGSVQIAASAAGTRTPTTVTVITGPAFNAAKFHVVGTGTQTFSIALTQPSDGIIKGAGWGSTADTTKDMAVTLVEDAATGTLVAGEKDFYVGGTLTIEDDNVVGPYTNTFGVAVEYN